MIEVKNMTKVFGSVVAVNNVSFHVEAGQIVGFLGPNGAGKSTTLRILTCFIPATSGSAKVDGYDIFSQSMQVRQLIGYLPEGNPLPPSSGSLISAGWANLSIGRSANSPRG